VVVLGDVDERVEMGVGHLDDPTCAFVPRRSERARRHGGDLHGIFIVTAIRA
jgi:hypothetical protein